MKNVNRWDYQWQRFKNEEENIFLDWIFPTKLEDYRGKVVLDAGCGNGGYAKIVAKYAKKVIGLDKYSIKSALVNTKEIKNIKLIKGDIENFIYNRRFDAIYSVGVLHHLNNPEKGFNNLIKNLKNGGMINVWVYAKEGNWFVINIIEPLKRIILLKLPLPALKIVSYLSTLILYIFSWLMYKLPFSLPYSKYFAKFREHTFQRNMMNVFDKLNAPQTHWISRRQIDSWFKELKKVKIMHYNNISWSGFGIKNSTNQ